jgi:chorismate mutase / prephenate dehydrogenase
MAPHFDNAVIIGGNGKMGRWMRDLLARHGYSVATIDRDTTLSVEEALQTVALVVVSVPISTTGETLRKLQPFLTVQHAVVDLTSVKADFLPLLQSLACEVMSLHPMFGPLIKKNQGHRIAISSIKEGPITQRVRNILDEEGFLLFDVEADAHDGLAAITQGLTSVLCFLSVAVSAQIDPGCVKLEAVKTPNFSLVWAAASRMLRGDPSLYAELLMYNKEVSHVLDLFADLLEQVRAAVKNGDVAGLQQFYQSVRAQVSEDLLDEGIALSVQLTEGEET